MHNVNHGEIININIFFINDPLCGNPPMTGALSQVIRRFDVSFDINLNKLLYEHSV